ncbi:MAG: hypothetical protein KC733_10380 [Candidatus Omnitrophica bacterium]|nr:hypothetical protein [Candidatus Omnitrophota bacterium]
MPKDKPAFYVYMVTGDIYYFAVHISQYYGFAYRVGEHYYKVEITNNPVKDSRGFSLNELLENKFYKKVAEATPIKEDFFKDRASKFLNQTKR